MMRTGEKAKKVKKEDPPPSANKRERGGSGRGGRGGGGKSGGTEMDQAYLVSLGDLRSEEGMRR